MSQDDDATIERVAKRICLADNGGDHLEHHAGIAMAWGLSRDRYLKLARAALSAMPQRELLADMSDDAALKLSADIYDGMLSEPSSPQSKLSGSFEAETELSAAPGAVEEIRDQLQRELLAEALDALEALIPEAINDRYVTQSPAVERARAAADKIRAALDKGEPKP